MKNSGKTLAELGEKRNFSDGLFRCCLCVCVCVAIYLGDGRLICISFAWTAFAFAWTAASGPASPRAASASFNEKKLTIGRADIVNKANENFRLSLVYLHTHTLVCIDISICLNFFREREREREREDILLFIFAVADASGGRVSICKWAVGPAFDWTGQWVDRVLWATRPICARFTGQRRVLWPLRVSNPIFTCLFDRLGSGFTRFPLDFTALYSVFLDCPRFYWVLLGFTGFYWVSLGFTSLYRVDPSLNEFLLCWGGEGDGGRRGGGFSCAL